MAAKLATRNDSKIIKRWINSPNFKNVNFKIFFNDTEIYRRIFVRNVDNKPIGVVFYDRSEGQMAILVNPKYIGKGYGDIVLYYAHVWIERYYKQVGLVYAECCNKASKKLLTSYGYKQEICGDYFYYF